MDAIINIVFLTDTMCMSLLDIILVHVLIPLHVYDFAATDVSVFGKSLNYTLDQGICVHFNLLEFIVILCSWALSAFQKQEGLGIQV